jgi:hypothetical protein
MTRKTDPVKHAVRASRFSMLVRETLELPAESDEHELRRALASRGDQFVEWYDIRMRAIAEYNERRVRQQQLSTATH